MKENNINYSNNTIAFQSLSDSEKIQLLNTMIEEYKDSPKVIKVLRELKTRIEE